MKILKIEKVIFLERDIAAVEADLKKWHKYARGERDVAAENKHILDEAEQQIKQVKHLIPTLPINTRIERRKKLHRIINDYHDDNYYSFRDFTQRASHYVNNYVEIIMGAAQKEYEYKMQFYSIANAKEIVIDCENRLASLRTELEQLKRTLTPISRLKLHRMRENPSARINASPSFVHAYIGQKLVEGLLEGMQSLREKRS